MVKRYVPFQWCIHLANAYEVALATASLPFRPHVGSTSNLGFIETAMKYTIFELVA